MYVLATYQPDGPPPASLDMAAVVRDLTALSAELKEARGSSPATSSRRGVRKSSYRRGGGDR
jgi:hypothetical protein